MQAQLLIIAAELRVSLPLPCRCTITGLQQPSLRHICTWAADDRTHTLFLTAVLPMLPLIAKAAEQRAQTSTPEDLQVLCAANLCASLTCWVMLNMSARRRCMWQHCRNCDLSPYARV